MAKDECTHDCENCSQECDEKELFAEPQNQYSRIKHVYAVISGKGGVGKSTVTSLLASGVAKRGREVAILDADITGPSIPKAFNLNNAQFTQMGIIPAVSEGGIKVMSLNLLLEDKTEPVIWRGPIIAGTVKQFWSDVIWGEIDYMFVDLPPGTGDVPLTVFQSLPIEGVIVVTSPQDLAKMIVEKAVNMAKMMNIPTVALIENMSYFECPDCHMRYEVFGKSNVDQTAEKLEIQTVARLPLNPELSEAFDKGEIERCSTPLLNEIIDVILK